MLWPDWGLSPVALGDRAGWGCSSTVGTPPPQWGSVPHGGAVDRGSPWGQVQVWVGTILLPAGAWHHPQRSQGLAEQFWSGGLGMRREG